MPKEMTVEVGSAVKRWQIVEHTPRVGDSEQPSTWSLHVAWYVATVIDGVELAAAREYVGDWFYGQDVADTMTDATTRTVAYLAAENPEALYLGIRDALYALLQRKGKIPEDAE